MRELFIYYRLHAKDAADAQAAVSIFQAQLRHRFPALLTRLLRRSEEVDGQQTWMETYSTDPLREPAGVGTELQSAIEAQASAVQAWLVGPRHTEVFFACVS